MTEWPAFFHLPLQVPKVKSTSHDNRCSSFWRLDMAREGDFLVRSDGPHERVFRLRNTELELLGSGGIACIYIYYIYREERQEMRKRKETRRKALPSFFNLTAFLQLLCKVQRKG